MGLRRGALLERASSGTQGPRLPCRERLGTNSEGNKHPSKGEYLTIRKLSAGLVAAVVLGALVMASMAFAGANTGVTIKGPNGGRLQAEGQEAGSVGRQEDRLRHVREAGEQGRLEHRQLRFQEGQVLRSCPEVQRVRGGPQRDDQALAIGFGAAPATRWRGAAPFRF